MTNKILTACFALACSVALLSAQSQQPGNTGNTSDSNTSQSDRNWDKNRSSSSQTGTVKITGCLSAGTQPNTFMLNNASESSSASNRSSRQDRSDTSSSTSTPSEMARAESSYVLVTDNKNLDLSKHIGKRVEVTGTIDSSGSYGSGQGSHSGSQPGHAGSQSSQSSSSAGSSSSASSSGSMSGQSDMHSGMMSGHQLKVKSIRQIASSCQ